MKSRGYLHDVSLKREAIASFDEYPFSLAAVRKLKTLKFHPAVTFFVGENGSGKSTLLEGIAVAMGFNAEGGSRNFRFETRASHSNLHDYLRVGKSLARPKDSYFLRAESFYNVATEIERLDAEGIGPRLIDYYGGKSLHEQSHGEAFMALLLGRMSAGGLYLLDEPEAALSPQRQLAALVRINDLVKTGAQFIIATHSPILLAYPKAWIYACSDDGVVRTAYTDTEQYQVTKDFLASPQRMLERLFSEDESDNEPPGR